MVLLAAGLREPARDRPEILAVAEDSTGFLLPVTYLLLLPSLTTVLSCAMSQNELKGRLALITGASGG